jgi:hypothetical protein
LSPKPPQPKNTPSKAPPVSDKPVPAKPASEKENAGQTKPRDIAFVHGVSEDGKRFDIVRARDNHIEVGSIQALEEGAPIHGEVVRLQQRPEFPLLYDVETQYSPERQARPNERSLQPRKGPAQVASENYRNNWALIWSKKDNSGLAN